MFLSGGDEFIEHVDFQNESFSFLKNVFWTTISEMLMLDFKIECTFHMFAF